MPPERGAAFTVAPSGTVPWLAYACLAGSMALVGSYVGLSKWLVAVFPVFLLAWLRFGVAALAMGNWLRRPHDEAPLDGPTRRLLFLESFFGNFLFSICMLYGVLWSTAVAAGIIMAALPGVVALMSRIFLGERLTRPVIAGIVCAVGGIALVSFEKHAGAPSGSAQHVAAPAFQPLAALGHLMLVGAVLCEATYVIIGKRLSSRVGPKRISALVNLWGWALVAPLGIWQATHFDFTGVQPTIWLLLGFYALAASVATVWLWMSGLRHVPASQAGVFTVMLPLSAALTGVVFLGEVISLHQAAAFALALLGVLLATWPSRRSPA